MPKRAIVHREQASILSEPGPNSDDYLSPRPVFHEVRPLGEYADGAYTVLEDRATLLRAALLALGKRNQRGGFAIASHEDPHREAIEERYEDDLPLVVKGARRNEDRFTLEAKQNFWKATGYAAIRAKAKEVGDRYTVDTINARARQMWFRFMDEYGGTNEVGEKRTKYKARLKKDITRAKKVTKPSKAARAA